MTQATAHEPKAYAASEVDSLKFEEVEIIALDNELPFGVFAEGERLRSFEMVPFDGALEIKLSRIAQQHKSKPQVVLPKLLKLVVSTIGGMPVPDVAKLIGVNSEKLFERMALGDALFMLMKLRLHDFGNYIQISGRCPNCGEMNKDGDDEATDISTAEVKVPLECTEYFRYTLKDECKVFDDIATEVILRPLRVYDLKRFEKARKEGNELAIQHEMLMLTVVDIPGCEAWSNSMSADRTGISKAAVEDFYTKLSARDRAGIKKASVDIGEIGPRMAMEMTCRFCKAEDWLAEVPWQDTASFLSFVSEPS